MILLVAYWVKIVNGLFDLERPRDWVQQLVLRHVQPLSHSEQNHAMPALRDPMALRMDKVVGGFQRTAVALLGEGPDLIFEPLGRHRKIRNDLLEHWVAGVLRGKQTLDIFHHDDGGLVHLDDRKSTRLHS